MLVFRLFAVLIHCSNSLKPNQLFSMHYLFTPIRQNTFCRWMLVCLLWLGFCLHATAQGEIQTAKNYLTQNAVKQKLSADDINNMLVSSAYLSPTTGWYHLYFAQTYESIEVYNGLLNIALKDGQVFNTNHTFVIDIESKASFKPTALTPVQALQKSVQHLNLSSNYNLQALSTETLPDGSPTKVSFKAAELSDDPIPVKLYWVVHDVIKETKAVPTVSLAWNVRLMTKDQQHSWNLHIDAQTGNIIQEVDDVIHCNFGTPHQHTATGVCMMGIVPNETTTIAAPPHPNSYQVFDYPVESPNHGTRTIVLDPYTRFVPAATGPGVTNGWHDDGTTVYNTTRGNNVWAQEDVNNSCYA